MEARIKVVLARINTLPPVLHRDRFFLYPVGVLQVSFLKTRRIYAADSKPVMALTSSIVIPRFSDRILSAIAIAARFLYSIGVMPVATLNW